MPAFQAVAALGSVAPRHPLPDVAGYAASSMPSPAGGCSGTHFLRISSTVSCSSCSLSARDRDTVATRAACSASLFSPASIHFLRSALRSSRVPLCQTSFICGQAFCKSSAAHSPVQALPFCVAGAAVHNLRERRIWGWSRRLGGLRLVAQSTPNCLFVFIPASLIFLLSLNFLF